MGKPASDQREPMAKVDTAWLRMESPTNLMMITGVLTFAAPLDLKSLRELIASRFLAYRRFGQKPVNTGAAAFWETVPKPDLRWHVRAAKLPRKADKLALEKFVSELASTPLDQARPLWQFHLIENYQGGSVLVARIHHCYADGLALVQVMLSLTDAAADAAARAELKKPWLPRERGGVIARLLAPARTGISKALAQGSALMRNPVLAATMAREGSEIARELAIALNLADDPPTAFKNGALGARKRCAWAEPLPLADVKALSRLLRCTVNDILLACAAGALRGYLRDLGEPVDGVTLRATVPVNLRPLEHARQLGNHFGLVFLDLPVGEANPLRRLERVAASMRELKRSKQAALTFGLLAAVGMAPAALQHLALDLFSRKASTVATNVPGPKKPLYLAGVEVKELMFWVPQNGSIGMGVSILSYNGRVHFGLIADQRRVADPDAIAQRFADEVEKLTLLTLMEDWGGTIAAGDAAATLMRYCGRRPE
ncbi:MAG: wax ester/triacylglycerol synthase family O-acyltransferase [Xanthomonadaceae bacterium]|nr:wax ester/triacylglycerol synthase family O-acyltransferase [Xanthomonadaceae bacterium]MDE2084484.1 wax ester/triacylglycerol synthase family O-acyltransferase [Xanthomonadaceae bacterium]